MKRIKQHILLTLNSLPIWTPLEIPQTCPTPLKNALKNKSSWNAFTSAKISLLHKISTTKVNEGRFYRRKVGGFLSRRVPIGPWPNPNWQTIVRPDVDRESPKNWGPSVHARADGWNQGPGVEKVGGQGEFMESDKNLVTLVVVQFI